MRVADYIVRRIYDECAKHIFTVTGRGILYLTDAVAKHEHIKCVPVHHEQSAAYAAVAYASYTGKPGACLVSTGCASTNTVSGLLCAWQDGVPCIFISGQNMLNETVNYTGLPIRTFGSQESDIIPIVKPLTKYAVMLTDCKKTVYEMDKALYLSQAGLKGPVWIDVPLDIQNMRIEPDELEHFIPENENLYNPSTDDLEYVKEALQKAKRPVLLIGSGIRSSDAVNELELFVKKYRIPLTYAHTATDVYGLDNNLSIGAVGSLCGTRAGNFAVQNSDLLLILGCRMTSMTTGSDPKKFAREAKVIIVDINKDEHTKGTVEIDRLVISDIKKFLISFMKFDIKAVSLDWQEKCIHWKNIFPKCEDKYKLSEKVDLYYMAEGLSEALPRGSVLLCDAGIEELILPSNIQFKKGMRCIHPTMQGAMGFALPGAIGAYFASNSPVCAIIGDGSIMMNLQELETIRYNNLPIKIFIINNNLYAVIRKRQVDLFRTRTVGTDPTNGVSCPSFKKVADCFGISYVSINNSNDLKYNLKSIFEMKGPVICEISGVEDQEYLCDAYARNSEKRVVHRPIEDLSPFIDRELFLSEMVIEPIDQ